MVSYSTALTLAKHVAEYPVWYDRYSIKLTSGTLTVKPVPGVSVVIGSSAALENVGRALAVELAPVTVNVMVPGAINTPLM